MELNSKIFVTGHKGLVGSAIVRELEKLGYNNLLLRTHQELDLLDQEAVRFFFEQERPQYVFSGAAKVGGILANNVFPGDFIYSNLQIQTNVIESSRHSGVSRLLFLGSSCIYPRNAKQPLIEPDLLSGPLESTNRAYAVAKIAGIEMCRAYNEQYGTKYLSVMPTNLWGLNDNYDAKGSHVIPGLIRSMHQAKMNNDSHAVVWGTGIPQREFLYSDDCAAACIFLMNLTDGKFHSLVRDTLINIGSGIEVTILELTKQIAEVVGFTGGLVCNESMPDGVLRKRLDSSRLKKLGWEGPKVSLREGLEIAYKDFLTHENSRSSIVVPKL